MCDVMKSDAGAWLSVKLGERVDIMPVSYLYAFIEGGLRF